MVVESAPRPLLPPRREWGGITFEETVKILDPRLRASLFNWIKIYENIFIGAAAIPSHIPFFLPEELSQAAQNSINDWGEKEISYQARINDVVQHALILRSQKIEVASINGQVWIPITDVDTYPGCLLAPRMRATLFVRNVNLNI